MAGGKMFDREKMYSKIMPTFYEDDGNEAESAPVDLPTGVPEPAADNSFLRSSALRSVQDRDHRVVLVNLTENLVLEKLDMVLSHTNCCKCDRCKMDIIAYAMNRLPPHYVVRSGGKSADQPVDEQLSQQVVNAVLKAVLLVRKQPRH